MGLRTKNKEVINVAARRTIMKKSFLDTFIS